MVDEAMVRRADRLLALPAAREPPAAVPATRSVAAPFFDDLQRGATFTAPGITLTEGHAALHQSIVGDRLRLVARRRPVSGGDRARPGLLAHPMLVCDVAIGQSTAPSMRVLGNLFYRGLGARPVPVGTTLRTTTEVVARRAASRGRGIVALRVRTRRRPAASRCWTSTARRCSPRSERGSPTKPTTISMASASRVVDVARLDPRRVGSRAAACRAAGIAVRRAAGGRRGRRRGGGDGDRRDRARAAVAQHRTHAHRCGRERARPAPGLRRARHRRRRVACHACAAGPGVDPGVGVVRPPRPDLRGRAPAFARGDHRLASRWPTAAWSTSACGRPPPATTSSRAMSLTGVSWR